MLFTRPFDQLSSIPGLDDVTVDTQNQQPAQQQPAQQQQQQATVIFKLLSILLCNKTQVLSQCMTFHATCYDAYRFILMSLMMS